MSKKRQANSAVNSSDVMKLYEQLGQEVFETAAGAVTITMDGHFGVRSVGLKLPANAKGMVTLDKTDVMKLEGALVAAFNAALAQARARAEEAAKKLGITKAAPK